MRVLLIIIGIFYTTSLWAQHSKEEVRINQLFNFGWKFKWGEVTNAHQLAFDDNDWRKLDLPHDFQFEQPWDETASRGRGFKALGVGWYRKAFQADPSWIGRRILLDFEGIMLTGEVWLNGKKIGGTDYGYLGFESDITDMIKYDTKNVVAVRASTEGGSRWYTGGGLFRDVHLVVKDTISIARNGIFITTPTISDQHAEVSVQVEVEGIKNKQYELEIQTKIFSPEGKQIAETKALVPQKYRRATLEIPLPKVDISNPKLWSCETPHLYSAEVALILNGKMIDKLTERFGIRTIEFSKEYGLKLNGKKIFLKGAANHHDLGAVGVAAYETAIVRMMDKLKAFGFNHIRTSHNPYSKSFMKIADEKGILVVDELYDKWSNTIAWAGSKPWTEIWYKNLIEWIKRDRNHPSVILWSFGNELQFQEERCGFPTNDWGVTTYRILDVLAKRYDPTRKTTVAMYPARANGIVKHDPDFRIEENIVPPELATVTEVTSFNYCWDDYQKYLKHAPDMIIYQSEAVTNELVAPYFGMDRDRMVGLAYWGAIEYWGESNSWPKKGWNYSFFNHSLEPYPQAYLMKSIFEDELLVRIGIIDNDSDTLRWNDMVVGQNKISSHWNREAGKKYNIVTYTNADEVELLVNGKSIGVQPNTTDFKKRNIISWKDVPYTAGKITAIARKGGKIVTQDELQTTGKAVALKIETENAAWKADGMDLQYVKVYAVDSKGRKVPDATGEVTFDVSGAARIIAVDNGDHISDDLFAGNRKVLHNGFAMAILRSEQTAGTVKLKVTVAGLKGVEKMTLFTSAPAQKQTVIRPGEIWPDTKGNHIQAHGGGITQIKDTYYWYGEARAQDQDPDKRYVGCYSSKDLTNWKSEGNVLVMSNPDTLASNWVLERPKVFYNKKTKKYVMYVHIDVNYKLAQVGIAVSDKPTGPFEYVRRFRPLGYESRDIGQFIDDDGKAYLIFEDRPNGGFRIARLSEDYMDVEKNMSLVKARIEGGAIVNYNGLYYCIGSGLTGWKPNPNKYATATSLEGPWTEFKDLAPAETNTYGAQSSMLVKVVGSKKTTVLFLGDIWKPDTQWDSRYLWMPLEIGNGKLWLPTPQPFTLNIKTGETTLVD